MTEESGQVDRQASVVAPEAVVVNLDIAPAEAVEEAHSIDPNQPEQPM